MYTRSILGPLLLIAVGLLFLFNTLGVLPWSLWDTIWRLWPVVLILIGVDILFGRRWSGGGSVERREVSLGLGGAVRGEVELKPGVGRLRLAGGAAAGALLDGSVGEGSGLTVHQDLRGDGGAARGRLRADFRPGWFGIPWAGGDPTWDLRLSDEVPLRLRADLGIGESTIDLTGVQLAGLEVEVGVGQSSLILPARGQFRGRIKGGVGQVRIRIAEGLAVSLRVKTGIGAHRLPPSYEQRGGVWYSPGYEGAAERADLEVEGGIGEVRIDAGF